MGFRVLALNSEKGVKTPSWRILDIKNDPQNSNSKWIAFMIYLEE